MNLRQQTGEKKEGGGSTWSRGWKDEMKCECHKYGENAPSGWKMDLNSVCVQNPWEEKSRDSSEQEKISLYRSI